MESTTGEQATEVVSKSEKPKSGVLSEGGKALLAKVTDGGSGSGSSKEMYFRADKIDLKSWDVQLEKHLSRVWSRDREVNSRKEEWEIDLAKLDIRLAIARGTYGTVYRGFYDGNNVAGNFSLLFIWLCLFYLLL